MTSTTGSPVELMRTLDEKFLATDAVFRAAQPTGTLFISPEGLRLPDGTIDTLKVERLVLGSPRELLALRQRLRAMPLALTTPAWVPVRRLEPARHVRFLPQRIDEGAASVYAGEHSLRLDPRHPLWNILVADRGDLIVLVLRVSHALGDGMFGLRVLDALTTSDPGEPLDPMLRPLSAPRTGLGVLMLAGRAWWSSFRPLPSAWREYWRKPFSRRLRRWGGRIRRTVRGSPHLDRTPPGTGARLHHAHALLDFKEVRATARLAGTSVHNQLIATTLHALLELRGTNDLLLDVPISRRTRSGGRERNHITMTEVSLTLGATRSDATRAVDSAVESAAQPGPLPAATGRSIGYASYLPWHMRRRYFGSSPVIACSLWPVLAANHEIAVFGSSYAGIFSIAVSGTSPDEVAAVLARVRDQLAGVVTPS